jgi:hypothetical protein
MPPMSNEVGQNLLATNFRPALDEITFCRTFRRAYNSASAGDGAGTIASKRGPSVRRRLVCHARTLKERRSEGKGKLCRVMIFLVAETPAIFATPPVTATADTIITGTPNAGLGRQRLQFHFLQVKPL